MAGRAGNAAIPVFSIYERRRHGTCRAGHHKYPRYQTDRNTLVVDTSTSDPGSQRPETNYLLDERLFPETIFPLVPLINGG